MEKEFKNNDVFLAFIEPKKFATDKVLEFIRTKLSDENLKRITKQVMNELSDVLPAEKMIELELIIDEEQHIQNLRHTYFTKLEEYKTKRIKPISHRFAILTIFNNKLYDFMSNDYIDLKDYYINDIMPFSDAFLDSDWKVVYIDQNQVFLILSKDTKEIINMYIKKNKNKIDENAFQKIFKV